jgi:hypothetical protein
LCTALNPFQHIGGQFTKYDRVLLLLISLMLCVKVCAVKTKAALKAYGIGDIPCHAFSDVPWYLCKSVWAFPIRSYETDWFFNCWNVGAAKRTPNKVVQCMVTGYSAGTASASEAVRAFRIDLGAAWTLMWLAKFHSQA